MGMSSPASLGPVGRYAGGAEQSVWTQNEPTAEDSAAYFLDLLEPGDDVIDIGCGDGRLTLDLAEFIHPGRCIGIDVDEVAVRSARRGARTIHDRRTRFLTGNALDLPFEDDSFDLAHAHQLLAQVSDPVQALREMARVTRPGGHIATRDTDLGAITWFPEFPELEDWRDRAGALARSYGHEPDAGRHLRAWANAAGLDDVYFTASVWDYADPQACRAWGLHQAELWYGAGPHDEGTKADTDEVARMRDTWSTWADHPDAMVAVFHGELIARVARAGLPEPSARAGA